MTKSRRKTLTVADRRAILAEMREAPSIRKVARRWKIQSCTVAEIIRDSGDREQRWADRINYYIERNVIRQRALSEVRAEMVGWQDADA
jgi:hypothetical protein